MLYGLTLHLGANSMPTVMDEKPETLLGLRIVTLLHRQQKSVYALAKHAGVPIKTVQRICKGEGKQPSVWTIAAIARVLGVSIDDLVSVPEAAQTASRGTRAREDVPEEKPTRQTRQPRHAASVA